MRKFAWPVFRPGERTVILGPTGCGKSEIERVVVKTQKNAIIVDTKRTEDWSDVGPILTEKEIFRVRGGRYVFRVPSTFLTNPALAEQFFAWALKRGNTMISVDEQLHVPTTNAEMILATQGRAARVGLTVCAQRAHGIPLYSISEADHWFIFRLRLDRDRKRVEEATSQSIPWDLLNDPNKANDDDPDHSFFYINRNGTISAPAILRLEG